MPVCSVTQSLTWSVFAKLLIYTIFVLRSLNRPIPGCHRALFQYLLPLGTKLAGDPSCIGVRSLLFWNILQDEDKKPDIWCPGGGSGHLCGPKGRLWGTSAVQERTWDELAMYCNVFTVTCAPHAVGVGCRTCLLGMFVAAEHPSGMLQLCGLLTNHLVRLNNYKEAITSLLSCARLALNHSFIFSVWFSLELGYIIITLLASSNVQIFILASCSLDPKAFHIYTRNHSFYVSSSEGFSLHI